MLNSWWEKKVKRTSKLWKNQIRLMAVRNQNDSFRHIINILLTELSRSVWENLDLGRVYRPHCVRSVLTTSHVQFIFKACKKPFLWRNYKKKLSGVCKKNNIGSQAAANMLELVSSWKLSVFKNYTELTTELGKLIYVNACRIDLRLFKMSF